MWFCARMTLIMHAGRSTRYFCSSVPSRRFSASATCCNERESTSYAAQDDAFEYALNGSLDGSVHFPKPRRVSFVLRRSSRPCVPWRLLEETSA
jgi:hypothetical protein